MCTSNSSLIAITIDTTITQVSLAERALKTVILVYTTVSMRIQ